MFLGVLIFGHPPSCHTLLVSSSRFQVMTEFLDSQCSMIIYSQESYRFTRGQFVLTSDDPIMPKL